MMNHTQANSNDGNNIFCAQELNNKAVLYFEGGHCKEATALLHDGLKLLIAINHQHFTEQHSIEDCGCGNCPSETSVKNLQQCSFCDESGTLDGFIAFTEQTSFLIPKRLCAEKTSSVETKSNNDATWNENIRCLNPRKRQRLSYSSDNTKKNGYVYKQPIRIPLEGFFQCQRGYTSLLVVIVFNLAIVHRYSVIDEEPIDESKTQNIAFLYNLCLNLIRQAGAMWSQPPLTSIQASSTRCEMILHNNLSQLYRIDGNNASMRRQSLEDLLSTFMVLFERRTREDNDNNLQATAINAFDTNGKISNLYQGILENLDPLILKRQCANAA